MAEVSWTTEDRVILAVFGGALMYGALMKSWKGSIFGAMIAGMLAQWKQNNGK